MTTGLSPSGARIRGDEYQHLFAWCQVIRAISIDSDITKIGIEDPKAGNADDVTVYMKDGKCEYYQLKSSVDAHQTAGLEWLIKPSNSGGPSIIQGFYDLWANKQDKYKPKITLVTNRLPLQTDQLMSMIDGQSRSVARRLQHAKPKSKDGKIRSELAQHLKITEDILVLFLRDIKFMLGKTNEDLILLVQSFMLASGLHHDRNAVSQGVDIVRSWVTEGKREITIAELKQAIKPLKQLDSLPTASILVQAIDRDPMPENATIALDWVDSFPGREPRVRHLPSDPTLWNGRFRLELQLAAQKLRSQGHAHVLVRGYMRLPTWFAAGVELCKTAGFEVSSF